MDRSDIVYIANCYEQNDTQRFHYNVTFFPRYFYYRIVRKFHNI